MIKRDGKTQPFLKNKVIVAVEKAFKEVDGQLNDWTRYKAKEIATFVETLEDKNVENIQDQIENKLMASSRKDVAKAFIRYRYIRELERAKDAKILKSIEDKLMARDVQNQNANIDEQSFGGRVGEASDLVLKRYALDNLISEKARHNHLNNEIYIHDLNSYAIGMHNCLSIPIDKLLENGFKTRQVDIRPASSINTAFQLLAVIMQIQSLQQFGKQLCRN